MQKVVSNYVYAIDGMELTENGKSVGFLVIASEMRDLSVFGNIKEIKKVVEYTADEGKIFKHKQTGELVYIIKEAELNLFEEIEEEIEEVEVD